MRLFYLALLLPSVIVAQEPNGRAGARTAQPANRYVKGGWGLDLTSQYFFRGILQENQGIIVQPWFELGYDLYEGDDAVRDLDAKVGFWNSVQDEPDGTGGNWYEADFYLDVGMQFRERWQFDARYTTYSSPNGAGRFFGPVQELSFRAAFADDKEPLIGIFESGLRPHALIAFELDGNRDAGNDEGVYLEVGVEPQFQLIKEDQSFPLRLAVPATLGLSLTNYYEDINGSDDFFGYFDLGGELSTPMKFMPERLGKWDATLGLHWLLLGDNLEGFNNGDTTELVLSIGMATTF
ncbi:MAG TPA: hypothetical protein VFL14_13925 [Xanthomonadales bacterium]|nr:hypothetical protein [Xanthomonadales bacterium]